MQVQTKEGIKDVAIIDVTPENYIVKKGEEHLYHAVIEVKKFNTNTGARQSKPRIQKFGKKSFESGGVRTNLTKQGYDIIILHDPNEWSKNNQELAAQRQAENDAKAAEKQAEAKAAKEAAEQKKIDDAVAAALEKQAEANQKQIDAAVKAALAAQAKTPAKTEAKAETKGTTEAKTK